MTSPTEPYDPTEVETKKPKTKQIPQKSNYLHFLKTSILTDPDEDSLDIERTFILVIRGIREEFTVTNAGDLVVGRTSLDDDVTVDIDLVPYGAERYGVSRNHAQFTLDDRKHLYVTDLGSTNGTMLAGRRLKPNVRSLIHNGDKIVFGTLMVQIYFR